MADEYDDLLARVRSGEKPAAPKLDEYDTLLAQVRNQPDISRAQALAWNGSFSNTTREAEKHKLSRELKTYLGEESPPAIMDVDEARRKVRAAELDHGLRQSDGLRQWIEADPGNAALLDGKQAKEFGFFERKWRAAAGSLSQFGSSLVGIGESLDAAQRLTLNKFADVVLPVPRAGGRASPESITGPTMGGDWVAAGKPSKDFWRGVDVPADQRDFGDDVVAGLSQFAGQAAMLAANPGLGVPMLFGQGADQLADKTAKDGGPQQNRDLAILGGGVVTGATEWAANKFVFGLEKIPGLKLLDFKNAMAGRVARTTLAGLGEGAQETSESLLHDTLRQQLTNINAPIDMAGSLYEGGVGATVGAIARGMIESALHIRARGTRQALETLDAVAKDSTLRETVPEKYRDFIARATANGPVENVYIPAEQFVTYFQAQGIDPAQAAQAIGATNYAEAASVGSDVVIPLADFATHVAGTDHMAGLADDVRLHQGDLTARELAVEEANREQSDARMKAQIEALVAEGQKAQGLNAAIDTITNDVEGQLIGAGVELSAARTQAQLLRGVAVLAERAFPGQDPVQSASKLWAKYGLTVRRDMPAVLTQIKSANLDVDPLLDMLRGTGGPTDTATFGQSLVTFLRERGGLAQIGELLDAASYPTPAGQKKLITDNGMTLDDAAMTAQEAGYFQNTDHTALVEAILNELNGNPAYSMNQTDERAMGVQQSLAMLNQAVKDAGIDLNAVTDNAEVRRILEQSGPVTGARFDQPEVGAGATAMRELADLAKADGNENRTVEIGAVPQWEVQAAADAGINIEGFRHTADMFAVRHAFKKHGDEQAEASRGQIALTDSDLAALPGVVLFPDSIILGLKNDRKQDMVLSVKAMPDGTLLVAEEVRTGKKVLALSSFRKVPGAKNAKELLPSVLLNVHDDAGVEPIIVDAPKNLNQAPRLSEIVQQLETSGLKIDAYENKGIITLSKLIVPEGERSAGKGTAAMRALIDYADQTGQHVTLSPSADFGGNKKRLVEFYKRFGFVENKGKNSAFSTSESMYRQAAGKVLLQDKRGYLQIGPDRQMKIGLTESANLSTFLHETGHFYLEMMGDLAEMEGVDAQVKADYAALLKWLGVSSRAEIETKHHEMFARANEAYLMEGKAPAPELQGAFQRFKAWLTAIYRKIETLDVKLSGEVRDVFERIYATDAEIMAAQDQVSIAPLFLDAATAKMSEAEFAAYAGEVAQVSGKAREELLAKLMREFERGKAQWWKDERAKMHADITAEVDAQPVYRAFAALTAGALPDGTPIKLARDDLHRRYGEDFTKNLPRNLQRVYAAENGTDTDTAAEMLGFASGDDLIKALAEMRPRKALIEAETDVRMRELHGDLLTDGSIEQEAQTALHNDRRADVLMVELRALRRRQKDVAPFVQAERDKAKAARSATMHALDGVPSLSAFQRAAAGKIEQTAVRDLNPYQYLLAGRKAARQAGEALARQDTETAAIAKQRELLNHYLYLEATKAQADAKRIADYAKGFDKPSRRQSLAKAGKDYLEQIDALLERFEFKEVTQRQMDRRQSLHDFIAAKKDEGETFVIPPEIVKDAGVRNWRQATMMELRGLDDSLRNLAHLANFKNKLLRKKAAHDFGQVRAELLAALDGSYQGSTGEAGKLNDKGDTAATRAAALWRKFDAAHIKVEQLVEWMDGGKSNGPWARYFFDLADDAQAREYDLHAAVTKRLQDLADAQTSAWRSSLLDKTAARLPGIDGALSRYDLISIALNVGNESNWQRLLDGHGWTEPKVAAALEHLGAEDWRYVQGVWDIAGSLWPEIAALQERVAGVAPEKIPPRKVVTPYGEFAGGYYPLAYDPKKSQAGEKQADATQSVQDFMARGYGRAATSKGHTKTRLENFAAPLLLDFEQVLTSHLSKVIKDISHREAIIGLTKILKAPDIKAALIDKLGEASYTLLTTWEQTLISDRADTLHQPLELHNAIFRGLRTHTAIVTMGWKISTAMSQFAGFGSSLDLVKPKYMTAALRDFVRHPKDTLALVAEKSGEMRHRANNLDRDVKDALLKTRGAHGMLVSVQRTAFYFTAMADRTVSVPTWLGGYRQALATGMSEEDAVRAGDRAVRLSQGAGGAKDLAAVQRNSELMKLLTMYYTPFSVLYARLRDVGHTTRSPRDLPRLVARSLALVILSAVLGELLAGRGPDDDEDKVMWAARKALLYPFASMPVIRDLVNWQLEPALAKAGGGSVHFQPGYKLSPVVQAVEKVGTLPGKVIDGWTGDRPWDDVAWDSLEASGYVFGLPTAQPRITGEYLTDLWTGDASPDNAAQALHDVLFRRPIERR